MAAAVCHTGYHVHPLHSFCMTILTRDSKTEKGSLTYYKSSGELLMVGNFENIELSMGEN